MKLENMLKILVPSLVMTAQADIDFKFKQVGGNIGVEIIATEIDKGKYVVEMSTNLTEGVWNEVYKTKNKVTGFEFEGISGGPSVFYRVRLIKNNKK